MYFYITINEVLNPKKHIKMENIINILKEETKTLKTQYITMTKKWAGNHFTTVMNRVNWKEVDWCNHLGVEPRLANAGKGGEFLSFPKGFYNTEKAKTLHRLQAEVRALHAMGFDEFIRRESVKAENHYEGSIIKLAERIEKKQLNTEQLKTETSHVGVNIETTLTDGEKTVRAFTIIASGPIQKPHYRYLVK